MNKKEILEIRKLLKKDDTRIDRICGCYVDGNKEKIAVMREAFLSLPEEEMFKYSDLFRKSLSGSLGKNLINMEFPLAEEAEGGKQAGLLALLKSELKDDAAADAFFDSVIRTYLYAENYLILLVHGVYDVPGHASDLTEMEDASEEVYSFLLCCICPVSLDKPGLCYDPASNSFIDRELERMVQMPETAFLYPAFNDRGSDIHSLLYYTKNSELLHPEIIGDLLGCSLPLPAGGQKAAFNSVMEETFGEACDFEKAKTIHENLNALLEGKKEEPEPTPLDKADLKRFLADCGAEQEALEHFEESFRTTLAGSSDAGPDEDHICDTRLMAGNLASTRNFEVKSPDVKITVSASRTDLIETRMIDGREYIVIPVTDEVEVNGIRIRQSRIKNSPV